MTFTHHLVATPFESFRESTDEYFVDDLFEGPAKGDLWHDGAPTRYGIEVFTEGDCWALAWYVALATGGRMVTLGWPRWEHVAVQVGSDQFLDVTGLHTERALSATWGLPVVVFDMEWAETFDDYQYSLRTPFKYPIAHSEVVAFADLLVERHLPHRVRQTN